MHDSTKRPSRGVRSCAALVVAGLTAVLLSGCVGGAAPTPTSTPTAPDAAEPIFASDEEALAAAEAAYRAFEDVSQTIAMDGGRDADRIRAVATPTYVTQLLEEFAQYEELGIRIQGSASLDSFSLVGQEAAPDGVVVMMYVCRDVSGVIVRDVTGADVTPADRDDRTPLIASLVADESSQLLVHEVEQWPGDDFC